MAGSAPRTIIVFSIVFPTVSNSCTDTGKKKFNASILWRLVNHCLVENNIVSLTSLPYS